MLLRINAEKSFGKRENETIKNKETHKIFIGPVWLSFIEPAFSFLGPKTAFESVWTSCLRVFSFPSNLQHVTSQKSLSEYTLKLVLEFQ